MNTNISAILDQINSYSGLAEWLTTLVAIFALVYTIREFLMKRRPYIDVEIEFAKNPDEQKGGWLFFARLINKGTYPGVVKVKKTEIRVGDESYPSEVKSKFILSPGESKKSALIGFIYKKGIKKVLGHEYRSNRVEIEVEVESGEIGTEKLKYLTRVIYQVHVEGKEPEFTLVDEEFK